MNYKLAKQLKDAGFPQKAHNSRKSSATTYYSPTLPELIEALGTGKGNSFFNLEGHFSHDFGWQAVWKTTVNMEPYKAQEIKVWGQTPEEVVVKLWIKLNK